MKSALELAMEKADDMADDTARVKLTKDQIGAIDEIKKQYKAKWAEQEIVLKGRIQKVQSEADPQTFAEHARQFQDEMNSVRERIFAERDEKIEAVRNQSAQ